MRESLTIKRPGFPSQKCLQIGTSAEVAGLRDQPATSARCLVRPVLVEGRRAEDEVAALAVERIRSGAVERTEEVPEALGDLGVNVRYPMPEVGADLRS